MGKRRARPFQLQTRENRNSRSVAFEQLEQRLAPAANLLPSAITVGRMLSEYSIADVRGNEVTLNLTVYNEGPDELKGVLLTDSLAPGVTASNFSQQPDQQGQNLAWSLGDLQAYGRTSVSFVAMLPPAFDPRSSLSIDVGAKAFAMLNAGMEKDSTPAAILRPDSIDPSLLASTPDANTTDPFIQEKAAELDYDPGQIYAYLHNDIGYESYVGSVRGARGTLWSNAGNSLDVASLGVALMRASGIPAQYVQGTLSKQLAQTLILSMFPASLQTVGYIPAGTQTADPANDPQLLAETEAHYWFQFDAGEGLHDADPLLGDVPGTTFAASQGTFTEVPDYLRQKTVMRLDAEIYNQAAASLNEPAFTTTTVLAHTFNDVDLVGRPLTIGHFVNQNTTGLGIATVTNTYSPYIAISDEAYQDPSRDEIIRGQDYQEVFTNFPLGTQILTGLFLNIVTNGAGGALSSVTRSLVDRIGYALRRENSLPDHLSVNSSDPPVITPFDLITLNILPGLQDSAAAKLTEDEAVLLTAHVANDASPTISAQVQALIAFARGALARFTVASDQGSANLASSLSIASYSSQPRIIAFSTRLITGSNQFTVKFGIDLIQDATRAVVALGQSTQAQLDFMGARGMLDSALEAQAVPTAEDGQNTSSFFVLQQSIQQGIPLVAIGAHNIHSLSNLNLPAEAIARITTNVQNGMSVIVPSHVVTINGAPTTAWVNYNNKTGELLTQSQSGGNSASIEYGMLINLAQTGLKFIIDLQKVSDLAIKYPTRAIDQKDLYVHFAAFAAAVLIPFFPGLPGLFIAGIEAVIDVVDELDPPVPKEQLKFNFPFPNRVERIANAELQEQGSLPNRQTSSHLESLSAAVSGSIQASWAGATTKNAAVRSLNSTIATLWDSQGKNIGTGSVSLDAQSGIDVSVSGHAQYSVNGQGSLSFFGPAESSVGVSGEWDKYFANVTGNVSISLTTDSLILNGQHLPAGTYTITTTAATLAGFGTTTSPNFSGSASVSVNDGTVKLGPGKGSFAVGGSRLDPKHGVTLSGYSGSVLVSATGEETDSVTLEGDAATVLTVSANPASLTTDQNEPMKFHADVQTSMAGSYNLTAEAPKEWKVSIDEDGNVTVQPAPGLQSGTYPIRLVARSKVDPDLVSQAIVNVQINPTTPGFTLAVNPDPLLTVPFNGAQLPTAFVAEIHNTGPSARTFTLSTSNIPAGFTLVSSGTIVAVPAGETGSLGLYLFPTTSIPAPGTNYSFSVSVSSGNTVTMNVPFTIPEVHAIRLAASQSSITAAPGFSWSGSLTITAAGNVTENVRLSAAFVDGISVSGLTDIFLQPGESVTEPISIAVNSSTPLNRLFGVTIKAEVGSSNSPIVQSQSILIATVVPGARSISNARDSAKSLGETAIADRLDDLGKQLTNLVVNPTNSVYRSQVVATIDTIIAFAPNDPYLTRLLPALTTDRSSIASAGNTVELGVAINTLGADLELLAQTLADEVAHGFALSLDPNQAKVRSNVAVYFPVGIHNLGNQTSTYDISVDGLPASVVASFNRTSITLQPGQSSLGGADGVILSLTETGGELFPTNFRVVATARDAVGISRSTNGTLTAPTQFFEITSVDVTPSFANSSQIATVFATVYVYASNYPLTDMYFTLVNSEGQTVFTSNAVRFIQGFGAKYTFTQLGTFQTAGLRDGTYTIHVNMIDSGGNSLIGSSSYTTFLVGQPVTARLTTYNDRTSGATDPNTPSSPYSAYFPVNLTLSGQTSYPAPLTLKSITDTGSAGTSVAIKGNWAYVGGPSGITIIDIASSSIPSVLGTFGESDVTPGTANNCFINGDTLFVVSQNNLNTTYFNLLIYSLADPTAPSLLSNTRFNEYFAGRLVVDGSTAYISLSGIHINLFLDLADQFGDYLAIDISDLSAPKAKSLLFGSLSASTIGQHNVGGSEVISDHLAYLGSTTATGGVSAGTGLLQIVDTTDPEHLAVLKSITIPRTSRVLDVARHGNRAVVIGSTGGWAQLGAGSSGYGINGFLTFTLLDITDPQSPTIIGDTIVTQNQFYTVGQNQFFGSLSLADIGNGTFAVSNTQFNGNPTIILVNIGDELHLSLAEVPGSVITNGLAVSGNKLFVATQAGLFGYEIGQIIGTPVDVSVDIPKSSNTFIYTNALTSVTFNYPPTEIIAAADHDTVRWKLNLGAGLNDLKLSWGMVLTNLLPGETRSITENVIVRFVSQGTSGSIELPPLLVYVGSYYNQLSISPSRATVRPGATADYTLGIFNQEPTTNYQLTISGIPSSWVTMLNTVTVPSNYYYPTGIPITITPDRSADQGVYKFTVKATSADGWTSATESELTVQGLPLSPPDEDSHGLFVDVSPDDESVGQGGIASYTVHLTNSGSSADSFVLSAQGLPPEFVSSFSGDTMILAPGTINSRDVKLKVTVPVGTSAGMYPFSVKGTSTSTPSVTSLGTSVLDVKGLGVAVAFVSQETQPGGQLQLLVTNTGREEDDFALSLAGPLGSSSIIGVDRLHLVAGEQRVVPVSVGSVSFLTPAAVQLFGIARSASNSSVFAQTAATVNIPIARAMSAHFEPASITLTAPGKATLSLLVDNLGNIEDAYSATVVGVSGTLTSASLIDGTGRSVSSIPLFRLPAFANGLVSLIATSTKGGSGTVTVRLASLNDSTVFRDVTATVITQLPRVTAVTVASSDWSKSFLDYLQVSKLGIGGYSIPVGPTQSATLPWANINTIRIAFSENVNIQQSDLALYGASKSSYTFSGFGYDPSTFTATWLLPSSIKADRLLLQLDGHSGKGVTDAGGALLDGDWIDGRSVFPTGDGIAGGDLLFRFNVLPGDVDGNNGINIGDYLIARSHLAAVAGQPGFDIRSDALGAGVVTATDTSAIRSYVGTTLPIGNVLPPSQQASKPLSSLESIDAAFASLAPLLSRLLTPVFQALSIPSAARSTKEQSFDQLPAIARAIPSKLVTLATKSEGAVPSIKTRQTMSSKPQIFENKAAHFLDKNIVDEMFASLASTQRPTVEKITPTH